MLFYYFSFVKIMKCCSNKDIMVIKVQDNAEIMSVCFETQNQLKISDYEMKLLNLDQEHIGIPVC